MNNKHIKNTAYNESLPGYTTATLIPMAKSADRDIHTENRQDIAKTAANSLDSPGKRKRVYLHSIGRFSNLKKLQMGTYRE